MRIRRAFSLLVASTACLGFGLLPGNPAAVAATHTVQFRNFQFDPPTLTVKQGDTVVFENQQGSHTVTGTGADPLCGQGAIPTSCQVTFNTVGTFPYRCLFHSSVAPALQGMVGTIIVEAAVQEKANVTPFTPQGWPDKIVVSTTRGTQINESALFADQDLFIDWAVVNTSLVTGITAAFETYLFVDGLPLLFWTHEPLPPDTFHQVLDANIGKLSAGNHTVRLWTDVKSQVDESNENDNQYDKVITVQSRGGQRHSVKFRDFQFEPASLTVKVGDIVVFENLGGTHTVTGISTVPDPFCGTGAIPASCQATFTTPGTFSYRCIFHSSAGPQPQGMVGTIIVQAAGAEKANVTPFAPQGWPDKIVISTREGTQVDETDLFSDQDLFIDWSVVNQSLTTGINVPFQTYLFVDGIPLFFWTHDELQPNTFHRIFDKNIGKLSVGDHTVRIWTDVTSQVDESNENDNEYQKVITVKARSAQTHKVQFRDFQFDPPALTIKVGDTVVFENLGGTHTVTGIGTVPDPFCGTGAIPTSCQATFTAPGIYPFRCVFHSSAGPTPQGMVGAITVEAQGSVLTLQSAATVEGPFITHPAARIDVAARIVRLSLPLASRYFRLVGPNAVRIMSIRVVGTELEFNFLPN